ncbi:hypothetical protein AB0I81_42620 [Nonomuraea sp. NPDC050404]|uniref:hypothetical protein n=1 Tax=Nonomuraea sp. NPDC050404 TaxID=3155783 RepID=UPI0033DB1100
MVVLAVLSQVTGDIIPLWRVVADRRGHMSGGFMDDAIQPWPMLAVALVLVAMVQAWALREVLRGRLRGEPARYGGQVRLLRIALYVMAGYDLALFLPIPYLWWLWVINDVVLLVAVWLLFRVLRGGTRPWPRVFMLATGTLSGMYGLLHTIAYGLGDYLSWLPDWTWALTALWPLWMASVLVAQARDPRWSRRTVRVGVFAVVMWFFGSGGGISIGGFSYYGSVPWELLLSTILGASSVFTLVWSARSAHDLGSLQPPEPRTVPARAPARWWPLPLLAIVLPLIPAAVNLAQGVPFWLGPKTVLWEGVGQVGGSWLTLTWYLLDLLVGVGAPALLILIAVLRRTHRLLRATMLSLFLLSGAGLTTAFTQASPEVFDNLPFYPDSLYIKGGALVEGVISELVSAGISPLWYALALTASGLILLFLYAAPPAHRVRHHVLLAGLASAVLLCLLPAADTARGPATAGPECTTAERWMARMGERVPELTAEQTFACSLRQDTGGGLSRFADTTPDQVILAYGRRMCAVHARNDAQELSRLKVSRDALTYPLAQICPSAAAIVKAAQVKQDQEFAAWEADAQAMCDATPRHRPRIKPAKAVRIKEPQMTDYGVLQTYEGGEEMEPDLDPANGLISSHRGILAVMTHSDYDLCITVETYPRRPPVETKGWDTVVEVGYDSPTGNIVLNDSLSGTELPNLALDGRAGHYRIRAHHAWFPWKGEVGGGQRLLIMAYPGKGDKEIVHRKRKPAS